jgi:hypoxanthine phosphoribosyltransferase
MGGELEIIVIMNSAFKFFTELVHFLNKQSEAKGEKRLKIRIRYVKITTQHLD